MDKCWVYYPKQKSELKNAIYIDFPEWDLYKSLLSKCKSNALNL